MAKSRTRRVATRRMRGLAAARYAGGAWYNPTTWKMFGASEDDAAVDTEIAPETEGVVVGSTGPAEPPAPSGGRRRYRRRSTRRRRTGRRSTRS